MAIFPVNPKNYDGNDLNITARMQQSYEMDHSFNDAYQYQASLDSRAEAGDTTAYSEMYGNRESYTKVPYSIPLLRPIKNTITGYQRRNRKSSLAIPIENSDQKTADQFSKILSWVHLSDNTLTKISDCFEGTITTGMNFMQIGIDYDNDPVSGDIVTSLGGYGSYFLDSNFRTKDLSDCNYIWKRSYRSPSGCAYLVPDAKDMILSLPSGKSYDDKFPYMPENRNMDLTNLFTYDEYWYRSMRPAIMLVDTKNGSTQEWTGSDEDLELYLFLYPHIKAEKTEKRTVRKAIVIQGKVFYNDIDPIGIDEYPIVPMFAYFNPALDDYSLKVQGVIRLLRDAQYIFNKQLMAQLKIISSQSNSGYVAKKGSVTNPEELYDPEDGKVIWMNDDISNLQKLPAGEIPVTLVQLTQSIEDMIPRIAGINKETLGSAVDDKAGILEMIRMGAGKTNLEKLFDQLDFAQKLLGNKFVKVIQRNFTPGKIEKIINEEPTQEFYNKSFGRYDVAIEEGLNTTTQRQQQFAQMMYLKEAGYQMPLKAVLEATTLQNKGEIIEAIQKEEQQAQQQEQEQKQLEMLRLQAQIKGINSEATANEGLGIERLSRVRENEALAVERRASAVESRDNALLDRVKALKELEGMDIVNLQKTLQFLIEMQQQQQAMGQQQTQVEEQLQRQVPSAEDLAALRTLLGNNQTV